MHGHRIKRQKSEKKDKNQKNRESRQSQSQNICQQNTKASAAESPSVYCMSDAAGSCGPCMSLGARAAAWQAARITE